jgi:phosphoglycolate phosphatase-like HAD superfamily hydrolase
MTTRLSVGVGCRACEPLGYTCLVTRLLLFDIDQTLIRTPAVGRTALDEAFLALYGRELATAGIRFDGRTDRAIFNDVFERLELPAHEWEDAFRVANAHYLGRLPVLLSERGGTVLPGVRELLGALATETAAVGVATGNSRDGARVKLDHFGLWECFAAGGFGERTPDRRVIIREGIEALAAVAGCAADGSAAIVIGDTPHDISAGLANGTRVLAVATGVYSEAELQAAGATWTTPNLGNTSAILDILLSA